MKHKTFITVLLINALLILSPTGCQQWDTMPTQLGTSGSSMPASPGSTGTDPGNSSQKWQQMMTTDIDTLQMGKAIEEKGKVYVVSFHPQGQTRSVDEVDEINITFSEPVAPLKKVEKNAPSSIEVQPLIKGEGYWKSSTTYAYRIDEKLKLSTRYDVRFKGYTAFSGKIADEKKWSFTTPTITILRTQPYHDYKWQTLDQKVLVEFSQDVDPNKISNYIAIVTPQGKHPFTVRYSNVEERNLLYYYEKNEKILKKYVTITPGTDYPIAADISVKFLAGLPSMEGNVGLTNERELRFRTYEIFKILSVVDKFYADNGIEVHFSNPVQLKHFREKISFEPKVEIQKEGDWTSEYISVYGKFKPGVTYTMIVPADVQDQFGNRLGEEQRFTCQCLDFTPFLYPPYYNHFVFENYLDKKIPMDVRNVFNTPVYYKELKNQDLESLFNGYDFNLKNINLDSCNQYQWEIPVKKNRNYTLGFDLETIHLTQPGYYYINFANTSRDDYRGHIFQLTDVALVAKYSPTQVFLVPFNMKTGDLVPGLSFKVENYKKTGSEGFLGEVKGNEQGIAIFKPTIEKLQNNPLMDCFVFSQPKKSFIWGQKPEMLEMWNFTYDSADINYNYNPSYYYNHLLAFTDKYLYKGGQTVKFKGIFRQIIDGIMKTPRLKHISLEVFNSRNQSIKKMEIKGDQVTAYGSFAGEFALPQEAPTGFYRIKFIGQLEKTRVNQEVTFSVQEYKPAKFEVAVSFDQDSLIAGQLFSGKVNARYLFGTPMQNAEGNCVWTIQPTYYTPQGWEKYTFGTYDSFNRETIFKKDFQLDQEGNFQFEKEPLTLPGKNSASLTVHGEVKDKDNNRISSSKSLVVHRGEYYVGLKTGSYFFKQNKPGKIQVVAVTPKGKLFNDAVLQMKITREEWKSFQQKDASGALRWDWKQLTEDILQENISLPGGTFEKEYTFNKTGYYKIDLEGHDKLNNTVTTSGYFYVTGSGYVSWGVQEGRVIDLVTDKKEYKPGESIELLIKSPFETATALITVEREQVIWSKVIRLKGNAQAVQIPVQKDFMPNAYINVIILKERTGLKFDEEGNDIGKPEFYAGYTGVQIDAGENRLTVEVKAHQESYEPGETVKLDIRVTGPQGAPVQSEVCLSVVDKGVLNLVGYQLPDPFEFFWKNRALDVKTVSTLNDVLGRRLFKEKGEDPGGDGGGAAFGSVVVRKKFKESAFYSAFIETDKNGKAQVSFQLPDNLTTFKAMAVVGTTGNRFGRGQKDILVKKNIILSPAVPNFSRPGDQYSAGVTVTNNSGQPLKIAVDVQYENVERVKGDPDVKNIALKPGDTQPVWFQFKVNGIKPQKLTFRAVGGRFSDGLYQEIPVRIPQFTEAAANFGRVDKEAVTERMIVPDGTLRVLDKAEITLASSAMVGVKRNFEILQEFPYDCLEQRISKQYPLLAAGDFLLTYGLLDMKKPGIDNRIIDLLKLMPKYQEVNGGFKYWPECCCTSPYLTCYAAEFILDAKKKGYSFDGEMLKKAKEYLNTVALHEVDSRYPYSKNVWLLVQSYAVYVLAKDNVFVKDAINNLFEVRDRIPFSGLAYLVKALDLKHDLPAYMQPVLARTMVNKMKDEPTMTHFENYEDDSWWCIHETNIKTTAVVLEAFLEVYGRFPYAEKIARWLTQTTNQKRFMSTQDHIRMFMAFERYYRVFEGETPDFVAEVLFNKIPKIDQTFRGRDLTTQTHAVYLKDYQPGDSIDAVFKKQGTGMLYYLLRLKYYPIGEVEAIDRGFKVTKTYKTLEGTVVTGNTFKAGEKYLVEATVDTKMERSFVILDDPLPAGLKVLNPDFQTTSQYDVQETRASRDSEWAGYWGNFYRSEIYFDRVQVFADYLNRGVHTWKYLVIATNAGDFAVPNTVVLEMYNPEVFGRNANRRVRVQ
jgi:uncharacterized protein YfaS (alpha-2-macroglobulin family)